MDILLIFLLLFLMKSLSIRGKEPGALRAGELLPIRGICAMVVVLHHVEQRTAGSYRYLFRYFSLAGYLAVAVFFAISGFALSAQYEKNPNYLRGFLRRRYPSVLLPYALATAVSLGRYLVLDLLAGENVMGQMGLRLYQMFRNGTPILLYSWYVEVLAVLYLLFYCIYRLAGEKKVLRFVLLSAGTWGIGAVCRYLGYGEHWYNSLLAFLAGILYFEYSKSKHYRPGPRPWGILLSGGLFGILLVLHNRDWSNLLWTELSAALWAVFVFQLAEAFRFRSKILQYLGSRSYEIYLCQGIPMQVIAKLGIIKNDVVYCLTVTAITLFLAEILHRACKPLLSRVGTPAAGR